MTTLETERIFGSGWFAYRWRPSTALANLRSAWRALRNGVRNWWRFRGVVWWQCEFDHAGTYALLALKLRYLGEHIRRHQHHVGWERDARDCLVAAELAARLERHPVERLVDDPRYRPLGWRVGPSGQVRFDGPGGRGAGEMANRALLRIHVAAYRDEEQLPHKMLRRKLRQWWC